MARLAGINIPDNKHAEISLTYIFGIGRRTAKDLCEVTNVSPNTKIQDLSEAELDLLRSEIAKLPVPGTKPRVSYCTCQAVSVAPAVHKKSALEVVIFEEVRRVGAKQLGTGVNTELLL